MKLKIKKGDTVKVIAGSSKGKTGKVKLVDKEKMRIVVDGVNVRKKFLKPTQTNPRGSVEDREMAIHYSNVTLSEKKTAKAKDSKSKNA